MFEIIQHTADVRMRVAAPSREALFADALRGLMSVMQPEAITTNAVVAAIAIDAPDTTVLLVDFLNEALTRAVVRRDMYTSAEFGSFTDTSLVATLSGVSVGGFREDVKAVTYHEAEVELRDGEWSTNLVFDI